MHKLHPPLRTSILPPIQHLPSIPIPIHLPDPDTKPDTIPLPPPQPLTNNLSNPFNKPSRRRRLLLHTARGDGEDHDHRAERVANLAGLVREERCRPLGRVVGEVEPDGDRGGVVGRHEGEVVRRAG